MTGRKPAGRGKQPLSKPSALNEEVPDQVAAWAEITRMGYGVDGMTRFYAMLPPDSATQAQLKSAHFQAILSRIRWELTGT